MMCARSRFLTSSLVLVATAMIVALPTAASAGSKIEVGRRCAESDRPSLAEVNHAEFDALLQKYVDDHGMVSYATWKSNPDDLKALQAYLARMGCVNLHKAASREAKLAYFINVYNALTLQGILREYPTTSIRNHTAKFGGYNIWKDLVVWIDNRLYSLDDIEHNVLRKLGEPKIHLAIVCASKGCPQLANRAYSADHLDKQLTANGKRFFATPANFKADVRSKTVSISQLFEWYGTDFAPDSVDQLRVLQPMLPVDVSNWSGTRVRYLNYDWSLNDRSPTRK